MELRSGLSVNVLESLPSPLSGSFPWFVGEPTLQHDRLVASSFVQKSKSVECSRHISSAVVKSDGYDVTRKSQPKPVSPAVDRGLRSRHTLQLHLRDHIAGTPSQPSHCPPSVPTIKSIPSVICIDIQLPLSPKHHHASHATQQPRRRKSRTQNNRYLEQNHRSRSLRQPIRGSRRSCLLPSRKGEGVVRTSTSPELDRGAKWWWQRRWR